LSLVVLNNVSEASWRYNTRGYLAAKLTSYPEQKTSTIGQLTRAEYEQTTEFSKNLEALNQLRWTSNTFDTDLSVKNIPTRKDNFQAYLGENYFKYKSESWVAQLGYQEIVWGEAFGFNYADIINPKDQRMTFFSDAPDARFPLLLFNGKYFFSSGGLTGSVQFLVSPQPRFSRALPIDFYLGDTLPQTSITVDKEKSPKLFKKNEIGGKISASYNGYDTSLFTYSYLDRAPHYELDSATLTTIALNEKHAPVKSTGFSFAKTIYDYVLRTDIVFTQDKTINFINNSLLDSYPTNTLNTLISLDSPTYNDYSGVIIFARSTLSVVNANSFRDKQEQYIIGKITKNLGNDRTLEFSYIHELERSGHSIQTFLNWPITSSNDIKIGSEFYFGDESSNLKKLKKINSVFFSLKNYFQL
jgi:hypothetical protein